MENNKSKQIGDKVYYIDEVGLKHGIIVGSQYIQKGNKGFINYSIVNNYNKEIDLSRTKIIAATLVGYSIKEIISKLIDHGEVIEKEWE